jgi:phosphatidylserine decarboxylase
VQVARGGGGFVLGAVGTALAGLLAGQREIGAIGLALTAVTLWFFRDPRREPPAGTDPRDALSPADGRVVAVQSGEGGGAGSRLAVYLSLGDVHVVRLPVAARILAQQRKRGTHRSAAGADAAGNARLVSECETAGGVMRLTLVTGRVARRIVPYLGPGQAGGRGERFGLIRFGSRVELQLPPDYVPGVTAGDRVRAGQTPIARRCEAAP